MTYEDALRASALLGMGIDSVLSMTPLEIRIVSEEKVRAVNAMHETIIAAGWLSAVLERRKKIPSLDSIIKTETRKRKTASHQELERLKEEFGLG